MLKILPTRCKPLSRLPSFPRRHLHLRYSREVQEAQNRRGPIVALESTIISHGMPYPQNLHVAQELEAIVRAAGATPATIAVINNTPCIGLDENELHLLAKDQKGVLKASTRDLPFVCSPSHGKARHAATTVASTMRLAHLAGIPIFATGGLGGVHRGAEISMDISADLMELGRSPVTVVCAGIKSILDIAKSLEVLETQGVPVVGFGTSSFPAFFTNDSGLQVPARIETAKHAAEMIRNQRLLQGKEGMVIAVPNPQPADGHVIQSAIDMALLEAERLGIRGNAITPFLLAAIEKLTKGKSLEANIALVKNNVRIASEIAVELSKLNGRTTVSSPSFAVQESLSQHTSSPAVLVFGGAVVDIISSSSPPSQLGTSNPGVIRRSVGGVGRNIATKLANMHTSTAIVTCVGEDEDGEQIVRDLELNGVNTSFVTRLPSRTARYNALHDHSGDLVMGVADMNIFNALNSNFVSNNEITLQAIKQAEIVVCDGNIKEGFHAIASLCGSMGKPIYFEPTSVSKSELMMQERIMGCVSVVKPNLDELLAMVKYGSKVGLLASSLKLESMSTMIIEEVVVSSQDQDHFMQDSYANVRELAVILLLLMKQDRHLHWSKEYHKNDQHVIVSLGEHGVLWCTDSTSIEAADGVDLARLKLHNNKNHPIVHTLHVPAIPVEKEDIKHTNGAGDAFFAGLIHNATLRRQPNKTVIIPDLLAGLQAAKEHLTK